MKNTYKLWCCVAVFFCALVSSSVLQAQANTYSMTPSSGTFTPLVGATNTSVATTADGAISTAFNIGFSFNYAGTAYTTVQATSDGVLLFGTGKTSTLTNNLATTTATQRPGVAPLWDDLQCTAGITYQLSGTAPYRVLTVEWLNMEWNWQSTTAAISFQVKLYETTNVIDFVYRQDATAANSPSASIGIMGTPSTDFVSLQNVTAAPTLSTTASTNNLAAKPATGQVYRWTPQVPTPGAISQSAGTPTCLSGTDLTAAGTPPANTTWYWQTSATGTTQGATSATPYTVYANGTYYLRAYNSVTASWSYSSSSITVSNIPVYTTLPPAPTAAANPACVPGTTISMSAPPAGVQYFWQGMNSTGSSNAEPATVPYNVSSTGTYYVAAYETSTGCWSGTSNIAVTINSLVPNPPSIPTENYYTCSGSTSQMIEANSNSFFTGSLATTQAGGNGCTNGNMFNVTAGSLPVTITSFDITPNTTGAQTVAVYYKTGTYIGSETNAAAWTLLGNYPITGTTATLVNLDCADLPIPAGQTYAIYVNYNAQYTTITAAQTYSNADLSITVGAGLCTAFSGVNALRAFNGKVNYSAGYSASTIWYDGPGTGAAQIGSGSPFQSIGTTVLPNPAPTGTYNFYPAANLNGCTSTHANPVTVNVNAVTVAVTGLPASCHGLTDGSFVLTDTICGTTPFTYSVNNGPYGAIPTNLAAGTYTLKVQDASSNISSVYEFTVIEPSIPQALNAFDINYFNAQLTWDAQGSETAWIVTYGPQGFDPATEGETVNATNDTITISGLDPATAYEFYVAADCGNEEAAGPFLFNTQTGFLAWDNTCGPGFTDISTIGTAAPNMTDDAEFGITFPFTFTYQGTPYTTATIGNNGGLALGTLTAQIGFSNTTVAASTLDNTLFPFWDDMGSNGLGVFYHTIGTAPNRQFIVQWNKEHLSASGNELVYQIIIDEATNEFWYLYNDVIAGNAAYNYGASATIGASGAQDVQISFNSAAYLTSNSCVHFYYALCPNPTSLSIAALEDQATITWNAGLYGETEWTVIYGPEGFDPANYAAEGGIITTVMAPPSPSLYIDQLNQNTTYDVYVYSECAADDLTSNGLMATFTTLPFCATPTALTAATDVDSLEAAWNWTASTNYPDYVATGFNIQYGFTGFELNGAGSTIYQANGANFADTVVDTNLMGGGVYQVYVQAVCGLGDSISGWVGPVTFIMPLSNDLSCGAEMLPLDGMARVFNNTGATVSTGEAAIAPPATGAQTTTGWINSTLNGTVWYKFTAPSSGSVRVNATGINYDGQAAVYAVADCGNYNTFLLEAANDNAIGSGSPAPNFTVCGLTEGTVYYLMFDGFANATGNYSLALSAINLEAGTAVTTPLTLNVCSGDVADLESTITGGQTGGVWSSSIPSVNASVSGSTLNTDGLGYAIYDLQYRVTEGCAYDSVIGKVRVFGPSNAGQDGSVTACLNQPINLFGGLSGTLDLGGTWYTPAGTPTTNGANIVTAGFQGNYNYMYISGNGVCPNDTANVVVNVTNSCNALSLQEQVFAGVEVFPNPSAGLVFVTSDVNFSYEVTDANGRIVKVAAQGVKAGEQSQIDLSDVQRGIYFIRLNNDEAEKTYRIVIN